MATRSPVSVCCDASKEHKLIAPRAVCELIVLYTQPRDGTTSEKPSVARQLPAAVAQTLSLWLLQEIAATEREGPWSRRSGRRCANCALCELLAILWMRIHVSAAQLR